MSVEYLVTGKNSDIPDSIKPEIINLIRDMNHLPDKDINFVREMVKRLILSKDKI